jgi:hypothetical protein
VTYSVVSERGYCTVSGVKVRSDKIASMASSSACLVAYINFSTGVRPIEGKSNVSQFIGTIPSFSNNSIIPDKNATNGDFAS